MRMKNNEEKLGPKDGETTPPDPAQLNAVEKFYERFRGVPLRHLNIFIGVCAAAFVVIVVLGMLKGRGVI